MNGTTTEHSRSERVVLVAKQIVDSPFTMPGLLAVGAILRIGRYAANHSLWLDEAMLANNIVTRGYGRLLEYLDNDQVAPIAYLFAERFAVNLFGNNEYALRFFALAAVLGALVLFYFYVRNRLPQNAQALAFSLFVFAEPLIRYAAEVKQYGFDVFFAILMLVLIPHQPGLRAGRATALALAGVAAVWCSHPIVFVLAGIGSTCLGAALLRRSWQEATVYAIINILWATSFLASFTIFSSRSAENEELLAYWSSSFIPFPPLSLGSVRWYYNILPNIFGQTTGLFAAGIALLFFLCGFAGSFQSHRRQFFLFTMPFVFTITASSLGLYPFFGRFLLFLFPIVFALIGIGAAHWGGRAARHAPAAFALMMTLLLFHPVESALYRLAKPQFGEQNREATAYLAAHAKPGDAVFLTRHAGHTHRYYARLMDLPEMDVVWEENRYSFVLEFEKIKTFFGRDRVWVVVGHAFPGHGQFKDTALTSYFNLVDPDHERIPFRKGAVYLVNLSNVAPMPESPHRIGASPAGGQFQRVRR